MRRQDLNLRRRIMSPSLAALRLQCTPRQTLQTGYGGRIRTYVNEFQRLAPFHLGHSVKTFPIAEFRLPICLVTSKLRTTQTNLKSSIGNRQCLWWTWHDLNVRPRPSQSRALIPLSYRSRHCRFLIADCRFNTRYHTPAPKTDQSKIGNWQSTMIWRKGQESNLQATSAVVFKTTALPVRLPFRKNLDCELAGTPGFEPRVSGLESDGLPLAYIPE